MTPIADARAPASPGLLRMLRPCAPALVVAIAITAAVSASELLPAESGGRLLWWGTGIAAVTAILGMVVLARCATVTSDDPHQIARVYVTGLAGNLGLQALAVTAGVIGFSLQGEKFAGLAAFGLSFAATVTIVQVAGALSISRFLHERARRGQPDNSERVPR